MNEQQLIQEYHKEYAYIMNQPIKYFWDNMELDRKEEILKGIRWNTEVQDGK